MRPEYIFNYVFLIWISKKTDRAKRTNRLTNQITSFVPIRLSFLLVSWCHLKYVVYTPLLFNTLSTWIIFSKTKVLQVNTLISSKYSPNLKYEIFAIRSSTHQPRNTYYLSDVKISRSFLFQIIQHTYMIWFQLINYKSSILQDGFIFKYNDIRYRLLENTSQILVLFYLNEVTTIEKREIKEFM